MSEKLSADDVAYVRREKKVDEEIQQKLAEVYGKGKKKLGDVATLRKGWECSSCGYVNFECRLVCGECLDPSPAAKALTSRAPNVKRVAVTSETDVKIIQIGDRCYRSFTSLGRSSWGISPKKTDYHASAAVHHKDDEPSCDDDDDVDDDGVRFDPQRETFEAVVTISRRYFKFIIGTGGQTLQETQRLTGATIILPPEPAASAANSLQQEVDDLAQVIVRAPTANSVRAAQIRLDAIIVRCRDKVDYTHFLMIPLGKIPSLAKECQALLKDMMSACCSDEAFIDESIFISASRLHFTLLMLRLLTVEEVERAKATLSSIEKSLTSIFPNSGSSKCHFGGLHYMNDDPTQVHVLYLGMDPPAAPGGSTAQIQALVRLLSEAFLKDGFVLEKDIARNEKIHATLMNTKWRRSVDPASLTNRNDNNSSGSDTARVAFNATGVLHLFGGVSLGVHRLDRIELCALKGSASSGGNYPCEASISIP
jgi:hypothetical protein